ncbi:hypothetical protein R1flu_011299 [Riccia fluitans]|uniref:Uncharacterized protein n=1 Tax=Riccia fluitans TaxID=41844 RepID=A0ABD1ZBL4_9MARC
MITELLRVGWSVLLPSNIAARFMKLGKKLLSEAPSPFLRQVMALPFTDHGEGWWIVQLSSRYPLSA